MAHCIITGAAGFIGSCLAEALVSEGHDVVGIDGFIANYPRSTKLGNLAGNRLLLLTGNPRQGALKRYVNRMGEVELGDIKAEVAPGENATFSRIQMKQDALEQTDKKD